MTKMHSTQPTESTSDTVPEASELVGEALEIGYPSRDEPVVACDHVLLPAGEITAIVGPNGSGKSTLLRALAGQHEPSAGTVTLDGADVYGLADRARARRIGLLSQQRESPESITVEELVMHGRYPYRGFLEPVGEDDTRAVERAFELADITHLRDRTLDSLSGGQTQLVWIAMVLAQEPDVLLLDEPTTFLDLRHQLQVMHTIETLNQDQDVTVGVVLHDIAQAARYADNLIVVEDGAAYDWGPPSQVVTEELLATVFDVEAIVRNGDSDTGPDVIPQRPVSDCSRG